ncbi:10250_t:CDS:2 [Diversispora eburnea]|uniref:10250_t:CDS:1 n=1 Tax=Diversispora eburnea TaxID=1213867 RepID=A0A9N9BI10_9GLOM|nr:10250_t:CDS:2 [Diversispora eburnea]
MLTEYQADAFTGFICGAAVMITFHNLIISIILYKARKSNVSNINKIILNLRYIASFFYRTALAIFLLWRLRQIGNSQIDKWASIILFSIRTITHLTLFGFIRVSVLTIPDRNICWSESTILLIPETIIVIIDFLIDIYITVRLVQVLRIANKNVVGLRASGGRKTKRTLFTAVMYWNFVRLAVAFGLNVMTVVGVVSTFSAINNIGFTRDQRISVLFFNTFFSILLSYVVTVDAEIVKVIEGENQNKKGSSKSTSEKSSYPSSHTNRATTGSASLPIYNTSDTPTSPTSKTDHDLSMKRLSFFEWANIILGFRSEKNHVQEFTQEEFEEIIGGSSEATNRDLEKKGEATDDPNRDSNISGGSTIFIPE